MGIIKGQVLESIDWNQMSELGLIRRINTEILHPLGLAMSRDPETGVSEVIFVSDDGVWEYGYDPLTESLSDDEIKAKVNKMISEAPSKINSR